MRRIAKPWPPANVSPDDREARSLAHAEDEYLVALAAAAEEDKTDLARMHFDQLEKAKLREVMYREQRCICVYCERELREIYPFPRVEHWRPLSGDHQYALHWRNLYLSCDTAETCDIAKGYRPLRGLDEDQDLPWPTLVAYESLLGFTSLGEVYVRNDVLVDESLRRALQAAIERPQLLNLNHPTLVAARAAALDSQRTMLENSFKNKTASKNERSEIANELSSLNPLPQFISIRCAWLNKTMGKGTT